MSTTYTLPAGLSLNQKKAAAGLLLCQPCCSGSGSGSSGSSSQDSANSHCCCGYCTDALISVDNSPPATLNATVKFSCIDTKTCTLTKSHACGTTSGARLTYTYTSSTLVRGSCLDAFGLVVNWGPVPDLSVTLYCESDVSCLRWQVSAQRRSTTESATIASLDINSLMLGQGTTFPLTCGVQAQMSCSPFYVYFREPVAYSHQVFCPDLVPTPPNLLTVGVTPCFDCDGSVHVYSC